MKNRGIAGIIILAASLFSCKPTEILLHGDISGIVTDAETSLPIQAASVRLNPTDDTASTNSDGTFLLKNIIPDNYEIQSTKTGYDINKTNVTVVPAETKQIDIPLHGIPVPHYSSTCLDFGLDSTTISFSISNLGKGIFSYLITKSQNWITVSPISGEVSNEPGIIRVTVDKSGLSENIYNEIIEVTSTGNGVLIRDTLHVNINGVADRDCNYYKVVKIGAQTWMAENLNIGKTIDILQEQTNNDVIEKWCYDCKTFGGLYTWNEAMNYNPSDSGEIGKTQGICPVGWHLPTDKEVIVLSDYLGGDLVAGGKLKATGTSLWQSPNTGATNESGFTALPGGEVNINIANPNPDNNTLGGQGLDARIWTSYLIPALSINVSTLNIQNVSPLLYFGSEPDLSGFSVRCIKNPAK